MKKLTVEMNFNSKELFYVYKKASKFGNKNLRYDGLSPLMLVIKKNTDSVKEKFKKIKKQINIYENSKPITAQEKKSWPKRIKNLYREFIKMIKMVNKEFVMNLISKKESKYIFDKMRIVYNLKKDNKFLDMKIYEIFKRKFKGSEPFFVSSNQLLENHFTPGNSPLGSGVSDSVWNLHQELKKVNNLDNILKK